MTKKIILLFVVTLFSFSAFAQECATNVDELRHLVGNSDFSLEWDELSDKNPLHIKIQNHKDVLKIAMTSPRGPWATVTSVICKEKNYYVAKVESIEWGEGAPKIARGKTIKTLKIRIPYQSELSVSLSLVTFKFQPSVK